MTASSCNKFQCHRTFLETSDGLEEAYTGFIGGPLTSFGSRDTRGGERETEIAEFLFSFFLPHALRVRASCRPHLADSFLIESHVKFRQTKIYRCTWSVTRETHVSVAALFTAGNCLSHGVYYPSFLCIVISMKNIDRTH